MRQGARGLKTIFGLRGACRVRVWDRQQKLRKTVRTDEVNMKLDLQLYGIAVSATPTGVTLVVNGTTLRFSSAEFSALAHALASIQDILGRATGTPSGAEPPAVTLVAEEAVVASDPAAKRRGRPSKAEAAAPVAAVPSAAPITTAQIRGRPPKGAPAATPAAAATPAIAGAPAAKKRGRPPKNAAILAVAAAAAAGSGAPKKRGRPPKAAGAPAAAPVVAADAGPKRRGRPPKAAGVPAAKAKSAAAVAPADAAKRGPGRPRTDGTAVGAPRLVELVDTWMAENPGPKAMAELTAAAEKLGWVEGGNAAELLERHVSRAPHLFVRMPDGRFRRRADKTPVEAPKAAKVLRRRGQDEIAIVRVEAPGT